MKILFVEGFSVLPARKRNFPSPRTSDVCSGQGILEFAPRIAVALCTAMHDQQVEGFGQAGVKKV